MQRRNVLLPDPDGPSSETTSPAATSQVDALEDLVVAEALADGPGQDHRHGGVRRGGHQRPPTAKRLRRRVACSTPRLIRRSMRVCTIVSSVVSTRYQMLATMRSGICWKLRP